MVKLYLLRTANIPFYFRAARVARCMKKGVCWVEKIYHKNFVGAIFCLNSKRKIIKWTTEKKTHTSYNMKGKLNCALPTMQRKKIRKRVVDLGICEGETYKPCLAFGCRCRPVEGEWLSDCGFFLNLLIQDVENFSLACSNNTLRLLLELLTFWRDYF